MPRPLVTVFGGTGFLGRRVVARLVSAGALVRVAARHPDAGTPAPGSGPGTAVPVMADVEKAATVRAALEGADAAVNAVSLYVEKGGASFEAVHVEAAGRVAAIAREQGVTRLVHVSGIGSDPGDPAPYVRSRGRGEQAVRAAFPEAVIVRPAVMVAPDDAFLSGIAGLVRRAAVVPLFGRGVTRIQPVVVDDVAEAVARLALGAGGQPLLELAGPRVWLYRELVRAVGRAIGRKPLLLPLPFPLWENLARVAELLPGAPLTRHQVELMRRDNVASGELPGLAALEIAATPVENVLEALAAGLPRQTC